MYVHTLNNIYLTSFYIRIIIMLSDLTTYRTPKYLYTEAGRSLMIQHIQYLRNHKDTEVKQILPSDARRFYYCFDAFMISLGYDTNQIYPTMLINGLDSVEDFDESVTTLLIPSSSIVEEIITASR